MTPCYHPKSALQTDGDCPICWYNMNKWKEETELKTKLAE
jgi:hypothetical protein